MLSLQGSFLKTLGSTLEPGGTLVGSQGGICDRRVLFQKKKMKGSKSGTHKMKIYERLLGLVLEMLFDVVSKAVVSFYESS